MEATTWFDIDIALRRAAGEWVCGTGFRGFRGLANTSNLRTWRPPWSKMMEFIRTICVEVAAAFVLWVVGRAWARAPPCPRRACAFPDPPDRSGGPRERARASGYGG